MSQPRQIPQPAALPPSSSAPSLPLSATSGLRSGHLNLDIFSPVNQNGSFEFDRVLKSGEVLKRTRKTKQWKKFHLVLRPNLLSMYKNASEERLHKQISLSDLTAVAYLKDPKGRRQHVFGLFSPSRNYHLQAKDEKDARAWVELIRREARIDEQEYEMFLGGPTNTQKGYAPGVEQLSRSEDEVARWEHERLGSSSPEAIDLPSRPSTIRDGIRIPGIQSDSVYNLEYSGNDLSDFSDAPPTNAYDSGSSLHMPPKSGPSASEVKDAATPANSAPASRLGIAGNSSQPSGLHIEQDEERVIWHGYLLCLKSKGGVRQWKRLWVVLRPKNLAFYKNEDEYAATLLIPLSNIISAVEIDPISRSKSHCMQIIAEDKSYRLCATSEEALARWLGALKSQLARRKEARQRKAALAV
ncbi:Pleckstrin homology-like domain [Lasallia pustulata]|uniref:Pleckstrin homology-like domain n=1 Tax=Lasallia pustulata TaxID=136370 RepID=A0A1W5D589_9LECA|nr:Pleckstrin homology-like domain [Lasallia pustulata]